MTEGDHLIWSNYYLELDDWRDDLLAENPDASETELYQLMCDTNDSYLDDERVNLNIQLPCPILVIGDIGRWHGRVSGYKEIKSGNIRDCLISDTDYTTWYVDKQGELRCDAIHHDGINHYRYRVYKSSATDEQIEALQGKILDGTATEKDINRVTKRLGDSIGRVYGWSFPSLQRKTEER